ncbi:MAG: methyltransferase domain-containing protein [Myxococcales bacterium]|nr:methyltransferase domain-containing protein [Myxococcales bacterium]
MTVKETQSYYDEFSGWYERARSVGYHAFLDQAETSVLRPYADGRDLLEVGCGTGLILERLAPRARRAVGMDLSEGMLEKARSKGLDVVQGSATALPFEDQSFDLSYSVKVLAHVPDIRLALAEMARVTRPGGHIIAEFYNRHSVRYWIKRLRPGLKISESTTDHEVYTRYDTPRQMLDYLPREAEPVELVGIRVFTVVPQTFKVPLLGRAWEQLERWSMHSPFRRFGGFLMLVARKR